MRASRLLLTVLLVVFLLAGSTGSVLGNQAEPQPQTDTINENGFCSNPDQNSGGAVWEKTFDLGRIEGVELEVISVEVTLSWSDDEGSTSQADSFQVSAESGDGTSSDSKSGSTGSLSASVDGEGMNSTWTLTVECTDAGPTPVGPLGIIVQTDPGNSWTLSFTYTYVEVPQAPEGPFGPPPEIVAIMKDPVFWVHVALMIFSTVAFGVVGLLAFVNLIWTNRWRESTETFKRWLANPRLYRALAVHTWVAFFIAAVPLGMYVAGKVYGWGNAWSGFPAIWNPSFYDITNADHTSTIALLLWGIPLWLNRHTVMAHLSHSWLWRRIPWVRNQYETAPEPMISEREMAIIYFLLGIMIFLVFAVQPHGN